MHNLGLIFLKQVQDFNDDDDDEDIWAPRRKRQEVPCPPEQSSEDLAASLGLEVNE